MSIDIQTAVERINGAAHLSADIRRGEIHVSLYGRPAGIVTQDDLAQISQTATGWGKNLAKSRLQVWQAITLDGQEY